jgi:hypothetical protein
MAATSKKGKGLTKKQFFLHYENKMVGSNESMGVL